MSTEQSHQVPSDGSNGSDLAFLFFSIGPVQTFIAAARTLRDLWTGSYLLAWLTRAAMEPILQQVGEDAFVSPSVRGDPAIERGSKHLKSPCLPNRFLTEVPAVDAEPLSRKCEDTCRAAWREIADAVRGELGQLVGKNLRPFKSLWDSQDVLWNAQIESFFDIRTMVLPWAACAEPALSELLDFAQRCQQGSETDRLWTDRAALLAGVLAAQKAVRHIPNYKPLPDPEGRYPGKCSLLGTFEQMGPAELRRSAEFWEGFADQVRLRGTRTQKRERLCAVSLAKRFAWPARLADEVQTSPRAMRFEDTATVAATEWLDAVPDKGAPKLEPGQVRDGHGRWSGQWLHWSRRDFDPEEESCPNAVWHTVQDKQRLQGKPPAYYAILMLDGDRMGDMLRAIAGRDHQRRVSSALSKFAAEIVGPIVEQESHGTLIYSGGDDVLALLPTARTLSCARRVAVAFADNWSTHLSEVLPATVSAGLAVVHYKEDLRFALNTARNAEKMAKDSGRNALVITACRRSGEHTSALCPWQFVDAVSGWVQAFLPRNGDRGASDRWAYHLYAEMPTLTGVGVDAMRAEIKRQVNRAETATRRRLGQGNPDMAAAALASQFDQYHRLVTPRGFEESRTLTEFVTLCQTASFLARGRDE